MPIIKITAADIQKNKPLESGWYGATIIKIGELVKAKSDPTSVNLPITFLIDNTDGKEIEKAFNSKAMGMIVPLVEAVRNDGKIKPEDFNLNTDELFSKKVDVKVVVDTYEGRLNNKIEGYLPYGKSKEANVVPF